MHQPTVFRNRAPPPQRPPPRRPPDRPPLASGHFARARSRAADAVRRPDRQPRGGRSLNSDAGHGPTPGGQWQHIALARSFFRQAGLLVLDEPTANLDPRAE
ncbi:hypothetical protein GCM10018966_041280 [Streptomyces yanii]